jgi:hypothetical protein
MEHNPYILENKELFKHRPELLVLLNTFRYEVQNAQRPANELIIDDADLQKLLKVCRRTTANYRAQGLIDYSQIGGKNFYIYSDILKAIEKNKIPAIHNQLRFPV